MFRSTCPKCGRETYTLHVGQINAPCTNSKLCALRAQQNAVAADRRARGLISIDKRLRGVLDDAGIPVEDGKIYNGIRSKMLLFAPAWAVLTVEAIRQFGLWGNAATTGARPEWQRRRLLQLAALRWCQADEAHREAVEAIGAMQPEVSFEIYGNVWRLLTGQVDIDPRTEYPFKRRGERTREAVRAREKR